MNAAPANARTAAEIATLSTAFTSFVKATEELRSSYERLRERADRIDTELTIANESLRQKVGELDETTGHLHAILAAIPNGVVVLDVEGRIAKLNRAAESILEVKAEEVSGLRAPQLRDADGNPYLLAGARTAIEGAKGREHRTASGKRRILGGAVSLLRAPEGPALGSVEVIEDLTEVWELRDRNHRLDKLAALGEMSAVVAHEIRNPLNGVQGFADLLAKQLSPSDPKLAGYAQNVVRGVREVDAIITDLLAFAAPERFAPVSVELRPAIERAWQSVLQGIPAERGSRLRFAAETGAGPIRVGGDAIKLGQIFRNLFSNAIEASGEGGEIRVRASRKGEFALVRIQDKGPGVPADLRTKIFDPFFTTKTQGTGLGLAIVRKLVELHGGKISLRDGEAGERGACFELTIPALP